MNASDHFWAVILAAGVRDRCDPRIWAAIRRAREEVNQERICIVVERDHRRHWWPLASVVPCANLRGQQRNCGSAITILFAILEILYRDPFAHILFVPADHHFKDDAPVSVAIHRARGRCLRDRLELGLIAVKAERPAANLAYVVPGARLQQDVYRVREFLDRPGARLAQNFFGRGAFWSTFLFCAWGFSVLALLREHLPETVAAMSAARARDNESSQRIDAVAELYERLPTVDFARTIMQKSRSMMHVIHAPDCG